MWVEGPVTVLGERLFRVAISRVFKVGYLPLLNLSLILPIVESLESTNSIDDVGFGMQRWLLGLSKMGV